MSAATSSRITEPRRRRFSAVSKKQHEIFGFFLDFEIAVADDAEQPLPAQQIAGEQPLRVHRDQRFEQHEALAPRRPRARQAHEALDLRRQADQRLQRLAVARPHQLERQREAEIGNEGERMRRIDRERRQHREDAAEEMFLQPFAIGLGDVGGLDDDDADVLDLARATRASAAAARSSSSVTRSLIFGELLGGRQPVLRQRRDAGAHLPAQAGDAHHEEFVEIIGGDRQEAQLLEQRMIAVRRLLQNAAVELQPGQFAIDEALRRGRQLVGTLRESRPAGP